jgi:hypothetical protein
MNATRREIVNPVYDSPAVRDWIESRLAQVNPFNFETCRLTSEREALVRAALPGFVVVGGDVGDAGDFVPVQHLVPEDREARRVLRRGRTDSRLHLRLLLARPRRRRAGGKVSLPLVDQVVARFGGQVEISIGYVGAVFPSKAKRDAALEALQQRGIRAKSNGAKSLEVLEQG